MLWKDQNLPNELKPGLIVPTFIEQKNGEHKLEYEQVKLILNAKQWRELEPFIWKEGKPEKENINAIKEYWLVEVVNNTPFTNGRRFYRWVPRFHSKGLIKINDNKHFGDFGTLEIDSW